VEYDFVIVGAGSAGCVLANRLSSDPSVTVALVEAGGQDDKLEIRMPVAFAKLFRTDYDWNYSTAKQQELAGRELYWPRGRVVGGSSSLNAQMWVRGHRRDYDQWEIPGWSYDEVLPFFQRAERRTGGNAGGVYGEAGPIHISELRSPNPVTHAFLRACEELGLHPRHPAAWPQVERGRRLPASRAQAPQPHAHHRRAGRAGGVRGQEGRRRRARRRRPGQSQARGHPVGGGDRLAVPADALGRR
jgi:choline dehydrogenase-like flavoprotein